MKIAVTCENNEIFQHFGRTPEFAIFEVDDKRIIKETRKSSGGAGCGALAGILKEEGADVLICGGIGGGAFNAVKSAGIQVVGGVSGNVRQIAEEYVAGTLTTKDDYLCDRHSEEGRCAGRCGK